MYGSGEHAPNIKQRITRVEDLPKPKIKKLSRNYKKCKCPFCGHLSYRDNTFTRKLHDIGDIKANRPRDLLVSYSQHRCSKCGRYFNADLRDLADHHCQYTRRVVKLAVRHIVQDSLSYRAASWHLWRDHLVFVPWATIQNWVEALDDSLPPMT
jgi:transposase